LVTVFGAIRKATGIDPSMLRDSAAPENGMSRVISQLATWKVVDAKTAEMLSAFRVDADAAARAESITDTSLRDVFRIGASSREFWIAHEARTPISLSGSDGDPPCKKCDQGATISDYLGGVVGRLICGGDRTCAVMMAAASSLFFNQALGYCNDHPCGWPWWWPPLNP
jgi:hypothetical protein